MNPSGEAQAFRRGVRIAAGVTALLLAAVVIAVIQRDRPLKIDARADAPALARGGAMQTSDNGPLPQGDNARPNGTAILPHPPRGGSDLSPKSKP